MTIRQYSLLTVTFLMLIASTVQAAVYRWTDEQGRIHFSDKPPAQTASDSKRIEQNQNLNIMDNSKTLIQQQKKREANDEILFIEQNNQQVKEQNKEIKRQQICSEAKMRLETLQGPVYFTDQDTGKSYDVSIDEQKKLILEQQNRVNRLCY